jgi:hypothetical protein
VTGYHGYRMIRKNTPPPVARVGGDHNRAREL